MGQHCNDFVSFKVIHERLLLEKQWQQESHDRFRRALEVEDLGSVPEAAGKNQLINGSLFADAGCILLYFKGFEILVNRTTHNIFSNATEDLTFDVQKDCTAANTSDRYDAL